jgi:HSP20 family protein
MALIRWEPVAELNSIQTEMNRLFNTFFDSPRPSGQSGTATPRWIPPMDLIESGDHYVLTADLPGLSEGDVDITLQGGVLTISGQRKPAHDPRGEGYYRLERPFGGFSRSLTLPEGIDPGAVAAQFDRGVLEVRIPKPEQTKPRKVAISTTAGSEAAAIEGSETTGAPTDAEDSETATAHANGRDPVTA